MSQEVRAWSTATNALCRGSASSRRSAGGMWAGEEGCWAPVTCSRPSGTRRTGTAHHGTRDGQVQGGPRVAPALLLAFLSWGHPPVPGGQTAPRRPTHFGENVCTQEVVTAGLDSRPGHSPARSLRTELMARWERPCSGSLRDTAALSPSHRLSGLCLRPQLRLCTPFLSAQLGFGRGPGAPYNYYCSGSSCYYTTTP